MPYGYVQDFMQFLDYINVTIDDYLSPELNNGFLVISNQANMGVPLNVSVTGNITMASGGWKYGIPMIITGIGGK